MSNSETAEAPAYIPAHIDACQEAAHRISAVLRMISTHNCREDDAAKDSTGGYDLSIVEDALADIRDLLWQSATAERATR